MNETLEDRIKKVKELIKKSDCILIGAGAGLSTAAGIEYVGEKFNKEFKNMAKSLKGYTHDCTISFLDLYAKVKRNAPEIYPPSEEEQKKLAKAFSKIGKENDIKIHSCCEKDFLKDYGIDATGCMSKEIVEKAIGNNLDAPKVKSKREGCNCLLGNDIGEYNTCGHLCKYCYANANSGLVKENMKKHIEISPFLIGKEEPKDRITEAKQKSWTNKNEQISFIQ